MFTPSFCYLRLDQKPSEQTNSFGILCDDHVAYLGPDSGFLPPHPLDHLPPPFDEWEAAAAKLPSVCRTAQWTHYVASLPTISTCNLPQENLLRANLCIGMIAHGVALVGQLPIPHCIMSPWVDISRRLDRPIPCLMSLDSTFYNFDTISDPHISKPIPTVHIRDPWTQTKRHVSMTGTTTEENFVTSVFGIGLAVRKLPGAIACAQQATMDKDNQKLRASLFRIIDCTEAMVLAFQSGDSRPLSAHFVDHVEFTRVTNALSTSAISGERTASGSLFPSIHLLDAFFSRKSFKSEMGKLLQEDRPYLSKLFCNFYDAVREVSVFEYIQTIPDLKEKAALQALFFRTFYSFASEAGFLGKHRIRINAFIEIGVKVGRLATASGVPSVAWQKRIWEHLNKALHAGIDERMNSFPHGYTTVYVDRTSTQFGGRVQCIRLRSEMEALAYKPGDHVVILPVNSDRLVSETLHALDISADFHVKITHEKWKTCFNDHDALQHRTVNREGTSETWTVTAGDFLKYAALQPLDGNLLKRIRDSMFIIDPALLAYLSFPRFSDIPTVFSLVKEVCHISVSHLSAHMEELFQPMEPRLYSIASNMENTPGCVDLYVGAVRYNIPSALTFADGSPPWRKERHPVPELDVEKSEIFLKQYTSSNSLESKESGDHGTSNGAGHDYERKNIALKLLPRFTEELRARSTEAVNVKVISRARVILSNFRHGSQVSKTVDGVSSSHLWSLKTGDKVRIKIEPNLDFRIPSDPQAPVIMIALGTGAAPFRSFIHELIKQKKSIGPEQKQRKAWLILGARTENDIPFKEDIEDGYCKHRVISLTIALSREEKEIDPALSNSCLKFKPGKRKHVQDLFEDDVLALELWNIVSQKGHVYTCGRPEIERVVRKVITSCVKRFVSNANCTPFVKSGQTSDDFAKEFPDRMAANRRIHIDTYFSGVDSADDAEYTVSEVATHNSVSSCWVVFRNFVYDISQYIQIHPGGPKTLFDKGGRDMTADFNLAHGEGNFRIASMIEPYRIGRLDPLQKASVRLKQFMEEWSVPLLYDALEHRSVFMLDRNEFPELHEPTEFLQWRSPAFSDMGRKGMARKVLEIYEGDAFALVCRYFTESEKGKWLQTIVGHVGLNLDFNVLYSNLVNIRKSAKFPKSDIQESNFSLAEAHQIIEKGFLFHEELVKTCITIQRSVEHAMKLFKLGASFHDLTKVMTSEILEASIHGMEVMMNCLKL